MINKIIMTDNGLVNFTNVIFIEEIVKFKKYNEKEEFEYPTEYTKMYPYECKKGERLISYGMEFIFDNRTITTEFGTELEMLSCLKKIKGIYENENNTTEIIYNEN